MNGALLLDQGFIFNSADPMSIVEYANQTYFMLSGKNKKYEDVELKDSSLRIDPQQDAFISTGDSTTAQEEFNNAKKYEYSGKHYPDL